MAGYDECVRPRGRPTNCRLGDAPVNHLPWHSEDVCSRRRLILGGSIDHSRLAAWTAGLAASLTERNARSAVSLLAEALLGLVPDTHPCFGFFRRDAVPLIIKLDDDQTAFTRLYIGGKYLVDPLYKEFLTRTESICLPPNRMYSADFEEKEFYRELYRSYRLRDKISFLLYVSPELAGFVSLARRTDGPQYTRDDTQY